MSRSQLSQTRQEDRITYASRDEIADLQLHRLRTTLARVHPAVPHYRALFESAGVHPSDLRDLSALAGFPFSTKQDLRTNYPFGMLATPREELARVHASSGTTGRPTVVGYTKSDIDTWTDLMARSLWAAGVRPGHLVHVSCSYGLFTGGLGAHYGAEALGCTVVPMSGGMTARQAMLIDDFRPDAIVATPSYLLTVIDEMKAQGIEPASSSLRHGLLGAEPWTEGMRTEIEETLSMDAVDLYGLSEVMGPGVAAECVEAKDGPVVWEDHFLVEVIDPVTGKPLPDGEFGELVVTTLTRQAMPLIRYRTGDRTRLLPGTSRGMRRLDRITGRADDMVVLRGVNLFPTQIEEQVLRIDGLAPHFRCEIDRVGRLDEMTVFVEAKPGEESFGPLDPRQRLRRAIKESVGVSVAVEVVPSGTLERFEGKASRVVDRRPSSARRGN